MVLVLDDDARVTEYISVILEDMGVAHKLVNTADEAIATFYKGGIEATILDVFLPGDQSGFDVAKAILALEPEHPILFMTGLSDPYNEEMLRQYGDYLKKEFFFDTAKERIAKLLDKHRP